MHEISPSYYAAHTQARDYTLHGDNLNIIPSTALGILADNNNAPTQFIKTQSSSYVYDIVGQEADELMLRRRGDVEVTGATYLGVIVSADRQTIYWVNNTQPLP